MGPKYLKVSMPFESVAFGVSFLVFKMVLIVEKDIHRRALSIKRLAAELLPMISCMMTNTWTCAPWRDLSLRCTKP